MYHIEKSLSIAQSLFPKIYNTARNRNYHFCCVFRRNKLLGIGLNEMGTESARVLKFKRRFKTNQEFLYMHAELDAVSRLWGRTHIDGDLLFVVLRMNRHRLIGDSKPCSFCESVLDSLGINKVYWSNKGGSFSSKKNENIYHI